MGSRRRQNHLPAVLQRCRRADGHSPACSDYVADIAGRIYTDGKGEEMTTKEHKELRERGDQTTDYTESQMEREKISP